ncbi:MAG: GldG family protein [Lachnospiraceae bacterium]|nr:GldG family protein [Lachnospiraceae bacterium]
MKKFLNSFKTRSFRVGGYSVFATLILVGIVVLVNVAVNALPKRYTEIDTSGLKLFTLSDESKDLVRKLDEDITIYWLTTKPDDSIGNLLDRYEGLGSHIKVVQIDPEENPTFINKYDLTYYTDNSLIVDGGERFRYIRNADIFVKNFDYTDVEYYNAYGEYPSTTTFDGEGAVTSAINYVVFANLPKVYCLTGHGESDLDEDFENSLKKENMELAELSLISEGSIPEDCSVLLCLNPTGDFTEEDVEAIRTYLDEGGKMMLLTSLMTRDDQRPNIQALMAGYHVIEQPGFVVEGDSKYYQSGYPYYLLPNIKSHTITKPLLDGNYRVFVPYATGTKTDAEDYWNPGETITSLLRTSSSAYTKFLNYETLEKEEGDIEGPFNVGVLVEQDAANGESTKIVWFTSAFLVDKNASAMVSGGNQDLFINAMSYLTENESGISIHAKSLSEDYLQINASSVTFWEVLIIGVIPAILLIAGIYVFIRRRRK